MGGTRRSVTALAVVLAAVAAVTPVGAGVDPSAADAAAERASGSEDAESATVAAAVDRSMSPPSVRRQQSDRATSTPQNSVAGRAPALGAAFEVSVARLAAGVAKLDWHDVAGADGYELMALVGGEWLLLSPDDAVGGVSVHLDGSSAVVAGLAEPVPEAGWWFAVRARNTFGLSRWSPSAQAAVPVESVPPFDPFTTPTRSGIDLEQLREAVATVDSAANCDAAPALNVALRDFVG